MSFPISQHFTRSRRHGTFYLACGEKGAAPIIFLHGWPELSISWRGQLPVFGALGFRAIAPDMRGYGRSDVPQRHEDYALELVVTDMIELIDSIGAEKAIWVGHDWGAPVVWSLAQHHPERCHAIAALSVPYIPEGFSVDALLPLVDRSLYPGDKYLYGQWDYQVFYLENFARASGPDSWYLNGEANAAYAERARADWRLMMPTLFMHGAYDYTCETIDSRLAEPMRASCADLTEAIVPSGHWMAQEKPAHVNAALAGWFARKRSEVWLRG